MTIKECYDILGVSPQTTQEEIKKVYKKKAFELHPDRNNGNEEEFKKLNQAYNFISGKGNIDPNEITDPNFGFGINLDDLINNSFFSGFRSKPNKPPSLDKDIGFDFNLSLDDIKSEKQFTALYNRSIDCDQCHGVGGQSKNKCILCNGTGTRRESKQQGMVFIVNSGPCFVCSGTGEEIYNLCSKCNGHGFSVIQEKITFHLKKDL